MSDSQVSPEPALRWKLQAEFDASEFEADGIGDALMALLPNDSLIALEVAGE